MKLGPLLIEHTTPGGGIHTVEIATHRRSLLVTHFPRYLARQPWRWTRRRAKHETLIWWRRLYIRLYR